MNSEIDDLRRAAVALYAQVPEAVADDVKAKIEAVVTAYREQSAELERLRVLAKQVAVWVSGDPDDDWEFVSAAGVVQMFEGLFASAQSCVNERNRLRARVEGLRGQLEQAEFNCFAAGQQEAKAAGERNELRARVEETKAALIQKVRDMAGLRYSDGDGWRSVDPRALDAIATELEEQG